MMTVGSLFAGIGGFDLGFERAGFEIAWQVEIDPYATRVLERHWPHVHRYGDIRAAEFRPADVLCGGFPCQDISSAGRGAGLAGERSGLWREMVRAIRVVRPRYAVVENVAAILGRGMGIVLGDLATSGYDAEWDCLPVCAFGARHERDRAWIVAYPECVGLEESRGVGRWGGAAPRAFRQADHAFDGGGWPAEPDVARVAYGLPARVDRVRALGNAIVPQIAEWIAQRIKEAEAA